METILKDLRLKAKLKQKDSAEALGVGQSTISMWESGESIPQTKMLPKIAKLYGCTIEELVKGI